MPCSRSRMRTAHARAIVHRHHHHIQLGARLIARAPFGAWDGLAGWGTKEHYTACPYCTIASSLLVMGPRSRSINSKRRRTDVIAPQRRLFSMPPLSFAFKWALSRSAPSRETRSMNAPPNLQARTLSSYDGASKHDVRSEPAKLLSVVEKLFNL